MEQFFKGACMIGKDLISIKDLSKEEIFAILERARQMKMAPAESILKGKILANCFFEPSTRTRLSFEAAMKKLQGEVIGFSEGGSTSVQKGESLYDTMKVIGSYSDVLVIRHPFEGTARLAAAATDKPVINAGDGANEHPTQTLIDLFSIQECQGKLDGLHIACVGDLLYGRSARSLALALKLFDVRLYFVSPPSLSMSDAVCRELRAHGVPFSCHSKMEEVIDKIDVLYMTRVQKERFADPIEYAQMSGTFVLKPELLKRGKKNLKVLHPLPRVNEIARSIDDTEYAYYFTQAENGLYVRQALLAILLGK